MRTRIGRRGFVKGLAAAAGLLGSPALAAGAQPQNRPAATRSPGRLPSRREFVVRHAYNLTLDPTLGDIPDGDLHVKNGEIVAVGKALNAPGAMVIEGRHAIVLPGLIDTHCHMWTTFLRCMAGDRTDDGYFPSTNSSFPRDACSRWAQSTARARWASTTWSVH